MLTGNGSGPNVGYESGSEQQSNNGPSNFAPGVAIPPKRRDSSLNRENPFRGDALQSKGMQTFLNTVKMQKML